MSENPVAHRKVKVNGLEYNLVLSTVPDCSCSGAKTTPDKNGDFGAVSVTERSCAAPRRSEKVDRHLSDRFLYVLFFSALCTGVHTIPNSFSNLR